jgi:WD40 repeat protein
VWSHSPTSFAYQWKHCDSRGLSCVAISQATAHSYTLAQSDVGKTLRVAVVASNSAGHSAPATSARTAVVTGSTLEPPVNQTLPTISGSALVGQQLSALPGSWSNSPTSYAYKWTRCSATGSNCVAIAGAGSATYTIAAADKGSTLRVSVIASNTGGESKPATSAQTAVVAESAAVQHLEYIFNDGLVSVYDMDQGQKLVKTISLPQTEAGIRGVTVSPKTHMLFISYGGDGGVFKTGSVLAYDLVTEKVIWTVNLTTGIDSGQVSPDGKLLYMPTGENDPSGIWNILNTENGAVIGTIQGGASAHNTIASNDGRYVYLGGRDHDYLDVYETSTGKVREIGPLIGGVRPFTVNGSNTLAFTTATEFDGFQVSSITTGKALFTVSFGAVPPEFTFTAPSHGVSLSPDEKQLYVIDSVHKEVQVYDVSKVSEGVAPTQIGVIGVAGLTGNESSCAYDCGRSGWLQHSLDGRFVYVADSGEVIDTATRKAVTTLSTLANSKVFLEIDWEGGVPIATSGRTGVGYVG